MTMRQPHHQQLDPLDPPRRLPTAPALPGRYLSLTSFRRDGTGVATPVWFVEDGGRLLVETDAGSYKVRRIRRDPVPAWTELLPDAEVARVDRLMAGKYRVDLLFIKPFHSVQAALHRRRPRGTAVVLEITPS